MSDKNPFSLFDQSTNRKLLTPTPLDILSKDPKLRRKFIEMELGMINGTVPHVVDATNGGRISVDKRVLESYSIESGTPLPNYVITLLVIEQMEMCMDKMSIDSASPSDVEL